MIHTIYIDHQSEMPALRKTFRKKLMTGGAVIRLSPDVSKEGRHLLFERFYQEARPNNVASMVLLELARAPDLDPELYRRLMQLELPELRRVLEKAQR